MKETKPAGWRKLRRKMDNWPKPALLSLVKDLYDFSPDNRDFLEARFQAEDNAGPALERYRGKIIEQFFPKRGYGKIKLSEASKSIRDYRKATGNLAGTIDLMLTFVENGTKFTSQYGDIDGPFYDSLRAVLDEMSKLILYEGPGLYPLFRERIRHLTDQAGNIGWGFGGALRYYVGDLENKLAGEPSR